MQDYQYEIISINEKDRWIFLRADEWDLEEPDAFLYLLCRIRDDLNGTIVEVGSDCYTIEKDPCSLIYQWDSCFGITIVYPQDLSYESVLDFLSKYFK